MRRSCRERSTVEATDGNLERVGDAFFDDRSWIVRDLIVDSGDGLLDRRPRIGPPYSTSLLRPSRHSVAWLPFSAGC